MSHYLILRVLRAYKVTERTDSSNYLAITPAMYVAKYFQHERTVTISFGLCSFAIGYASHLYFWIVLMELF